MQEELGVNAEHSIHSHHVIVGSSKTGRIALLSGGKRRTLVAATCLAYMAAALAFFMVCRRLSSSKQTDLEKSRSSASSLHSVVSTQPNNETPQIFFVIALKGVGRLKSRCSSRFGDAPLLQAVETQSGSSAEGADVQSAEQLQSPPAYDFPKLEDPQARKDLAALLQFLETPLISADGEGYAQLEVQTTVGCVNVEIVVSKISFFEAAEAVEALLNEVALEIVNILADLVKQEAAAATNDFEASSCRVTEDAAMQVQREHDAFFEAYEVHQTGVFE
ncbi:hypothetical protein Esti_004590 [Eimeria stiedai]